MRHTAIISVLAMANAPLSGAFADETTDFYNHMYNDTQEKVKEQREERQQTKVYRALSSEGNRAKNDGYAATARKLDTLYGETSTKAAYACRGRAIEQGGAGFAAMLQSANNVTQQFTIEQNQRVAGMYPGSSLDCGSDSGRLVIGNADMLFSNGSLVQYNEQGADGLNYSIAAQTDRNRLATGGTYYNVVVSDGQQSVKFIVNTAKPQESYINDVNLQIQNNMQRSATNKEEDGGNNLNLSRKELIKLVNKVYAGHAVKDKMTMLDYAASLILNLRAREELYQVAENNLHGE